MNFKGLATGIGSLPLIDAQKAVDLILRYLPVAPFWPQLPKTNSREGMIAQFSENLPGLKIDGSGLHFSSQDKEKELELFSRILLTSTSKESNKDLKGLSTAMARQNSLNGFSVFTSISENAINACLRA